MGFCTGQSRKIIPFFYNFWVFFYHSAVFQQLGTCSNSLTSNSFPNINSLSPRTEEKIDLPYFLYVMIYLLCNIFFSAVALICMLSTPATQ